MGIMEDGRLQQKFAKAICLFPYVCVGCYAGILATLKALLEATWLSLWATSLTTPKSHFDTELSGMEVMPGKI